MVLDVDGGRSQISSSDASQGAPLSMVLSIDVGRSRISSSETSQGVRHQRFLALIVGAPVSLAPAPPPRGPAVNVS
jgi:hypothetical protein